MFDDPKFIGPSHMLVPDAELPADPGPRTGNPWIEVPKGIEKIARMFCGCGDPVSVWREVHAYLKMTDARSKAVQAISADDMGRIYSDKTIMASLPPRYELIGPLQYLLAYVLDDYGLTEHGTSIGGAWLTEEGEKALAFLETKGPAWQSAKTEAFYYNDPPEPAGPEDNRDRKVLIGGRSTDPNANSVHSSRANI